MLGAQEMRQNKEREEREEEGRIVLLMINFSFGQRASDETPGLGSMPSLQA